MRTKAKDMYGPFVHKVDELKALQRTRDLERLDDDSIQGLFLCFFVPPFIY